MTQLDRNDPVSKSFTSTDETQEALSALDQADGSDFNRDALDVEVANAGLDEHELLIQAYLDDELSRHEKAAFEERLKREPQLRERVEESQNALDFIEEAFGAPADDAVDLTEKTVERLNEETKTQIDKINRQRARRRRIERTLQIASPLVSFLAGFALFAALIPDVALRRERDAAVVERLVQLEAVGDFEFLEALANADLFEEWRRNVPGPQGSDPLATSETTERPYSELVKDAVFYRFQRRFEALDPQTRQRYRNLRRQIDHSPDKDKLLRTLDDYTGWLYMQTNSSYRLHLESLPIDARIQDIRLRVDESQRFCRRWDQMIEENGTLLEGHSNPVGADAQNNGPSSALREILPPSLRHEDFRSIYDMFVEYQKKNERFDDSGARRRDNVLAFLSENDISDLTEGFSSEGKRELESLDPEQRSSLMELIVSLSLVENDRRFVKTRPLQDFEDERKRRELRARRGDSVQELAAALRSADDAARDAIVSRPPMEARGLLMVLNWGFRPADKKPNENNLLDPDVFRNGRPMRMQDGGGPYGWGGFGGRGLRGNFQQD